MSALSRGVLDLALVERVLIVEAHSVNVGQIASVIGVDAVSEIDDQRDAVIPNPTTLKYLTELSIRALAAACGKVLSTNEAT